MICFSANTECCLTGKYYTLGQLTALSIVTIGRGPECIHPGVVRAMYNVEHPEEFENVEDELFLQKLNQIDNGDYEALLELNISVINKTRPELKRLFSISRFVISKFSAIEQFRSGIASLSPSLADPTAYGEVKKYLLWRTVELSFNDIISIITYVQVSEFEIGSNNHNRVKVAIGEFELLLTEIESGDVLVEGKTVTYGDILFFCTGTERIPPHGFGKTIDVEFHDVSLPSASTCGLSLVLPYTNIREKVVIAIKHGGGFGLI